MLKILPTRRYKYNRQSSAPLPYATAPSPGQNPNKMSPQGTASVPNYYATTLPRQSRLIQALKAQDPQSPQGNNPSQRTYQCRNLK
tara:strand:+ start:130 stop:387 length:258 start_codon:yes stop_codon:yes gene_type:complete